MKTNDVTSGLKGFLSKLLKFTLLALGLIFVLFFTYIFPRTEVVQLAGTEVKRMDQKPLWGEKLQDVRFIVARNFTTGETMMFRNQDFVFPPYFKFDSGDLSGQVMNFENFEADKKFLLTYYGFRFQLLSLYPNATSIKEFSGRTTDRSALYTTIFMMGMVFVFYITIFFKLRKLRKKLKN